jgi:geranylgeranylglycerol-phosphate geranylgeranyltransferase
MKKLWGLFIIIRPVNSLMMGFSVLIGQLIAENNIPALSTALLGFTTAFSFAAAAMVINDYYDRDIDAINEPQRPIPSGVISPKEALAYAVVLEMIGLAAAAFTNLTCLLITIAMIVLSILYTTKGKETGLPGNLMVSACVAMPFVYAGYLVGREPSHLLWTFGFLAFLANTGREITKGIVDMKGDKTGNIKTIAVSFGPEKAAFSAALFYLSSVVLSALPVLNGEVSAYYLPVVAVTDIGLIESSLSLVREPSRENARRVKQRVLVYMLVGMIAFIAGNLPGGR